MFKLALGLLLILSVSLASFSVPIPYELAEATPPVFKCPGGIFQFPLIDGWVGWLYADRRSNGIDPSGDHTGTDIFPSVQDDTADVYPFAAGLLKDVDRARRSFEVYYPDQRVTSYMAHVDLAPNFQNDSLVSPSEPLGKLQYRPQNYAGSTHLHFSMKYTGGWSHYNDQLPLTLPGHADDPSAWFNANLRDPSGNSNPVYSTYPWYRHSYQDFCRNPANPPSLQVKVSSEAVPAGIDLGVVRAEVRYPGDTRNIAETNLYVDKTGLSNSWSLPPSIASNQQYDILVKGRQTLRRKVNSITLASGSNVVDFTPTGPLLVGDLNSDNKVNAFDYALMVSRWQPKTPGCADLNRDGTVNTFDYAWGIIRNYNKIGDGGFTPPSNACLPPTQLSSAAGATTIAPLRTLASTSASSSGSTELVLSASSLSPAVGSTIDVLLSTQTSGTSLDGVGILVQFDPGIFQFTGADAGSTYPNFNTDSSQAAQGRVELTGLARTGSPVSTSGSLATLHLNVLRAIPVTSIRALAHAGSTTESHAVEDQTVINTLLLTNASYASFSVQGSPARAMPTGRIIWPQPNALLNGPAPSETRADIFAEVSDPLNGVREVRFEAYYDNGWQAVGTDDDPSDGWSTSWDLSIINPQAGRLRAFVSLGDNVGSYTDEVPVTLGTVISTSGDVWTVTWAQRSNMITPRRGLGAAASNGKVYAIGGWGGFRGEVAVVEEYNPSNGSWNSKSPMPTARSSLAVAGGDDGIIYAVGGYNGSSDVATVEAYNPNADTWSTLAPMPTARAGLTLVAPGNGKLYAIGGTVDGRTGLNVVEEFTPSTNSWVRKANMPAARSAAAGAAANGKVYVIGGWNDSSRALTVVEEYDPIADSWATKAPMPTGRSSLAAATASNGRVYAAGGFDGSSFVLGSTVEEYNPTTDSWTGKTGMPTNRANLAVAAASNGKLYAIGGENGNVLAATEEATLSSTPATPTPTPTVMPTATPIPTPTSTPSCIPSGWSVIGSGSGQWQCQGNTIVAHSSAGDSILASPDSYADVTLSATVSTTNREASLAVRLKDAGNGYVVIFLPDGISWNNGVGGIWLAKRVGYSEQVIGYYRGPSFPSLGQLAQLSVSAQGTSIKVRLNDQLVLQATDSTYTAGRLGLRINGDPVLPCDATFMNVVSEGLPQPTPVPTPVSTPSVQAPVLSGIEPTSVDQDALTALSPTFVTIRGVNFRTGLQPSFVRETLTYPLSSVIVSDANTIRAQVPVDLPAGLYDVVLTDPNSASARLSGAFTVVSSWSITFRTYLPLLNRQSSGW